MIDKKERKILYCLLLSSIFLPLSLPHRLLKSKIPVVKTQLYVSSSIGIFHRYRKRTTVSTIITSPGSPASGIFQYQHRSYFQDKLILLTVSKVVPNC